jgi:hypothetical protein
VQVSPAPQKPFPQCLPPFAAEDPIDVGSPEWSEQAPRAVVNAVIAIQIE